METQHRITEADRNARRGLCSVCGPTDLKISGGRARCRLVSRSQYSRARDRGGCRSRQSLGVTPADVARMLEEQEGKCVLCERALTDENMRVDHDHQTGVVRGLLCHGCNVRLGWIEKRLARIIQYLGRGRA